MKWKEITFSSSLATPGISVPWFASGCISLDMIFEARARVSRCQVLPDTGWPLQPLVATALTQHQWGQGRAELQTKPSSPYVPLCILSVNHHKRHARWARRANSLHPWLEPNSSEHMSQDRNSSCWPKGCDSREGWRLAEPQGWAHSSWEPQWSLACISSPAGSGALAPAVPSHSCSSSISLWHMPLPVLQRVCHVLELASQQHWRFRQHQGRSRGRASLREKRRQNTRLLWGNNYH